MRSPFVIFRKHAKVLTVILTGLAMFAFIVMDQLQSTPQLFPILMGGMLAGTAFWILGRPTGHSTEYGVFGIVLGVIFMAYVRPMIWAPPPAVQLSIGNLSDQELQKLQQRRHAANQFLAAAMSEAGVYNRQRMDTYAFRFRRGRDEREDVVLGHVLLHEADQMGVELSDEAVNEFINQVTDNRLSRSGFKKVRTRMGLSEADLYDILRDQLRARMAFILLVPNEAATPHDFWDIYRRLNVKSEVAVVPVPTEPFIEEGRPDDAAVQAFFEQYKDNFPQPGLSPLPAFGQPRKVRLAFLAVDYKKARARVESSRTVTEEQIEEFYEQHKEQRFKNPSFPDDELPTNGPAESLPPGPVEAPVPEGAGPRLKAPPPFGDQGDTDAADTTDGPADAQAPSEQGALPPDEQLRELGAPPLQPVLFQDEAGSASDADSGKSLPVEAPNPVTEGPEQAPQPVEAPVPGERQQDEPRPEYLPLEEVREEIREELLRRWTVERVSAIRRKAAEFVQEIGVEYGESLDDDDLELTPEEITSRVKAYARKNGLRYAELPLLSAAELSERGSEAADLWNELQGAEATPTEQERRQLNYLVVQATDTLLSGDSESFSQPVSVLEAVFQSRSDSLYTAGSARDEQLSRDQYVYWKTEDVEAHVPTLNEPGVREQVVEALKQYEARTPARERAEELAKQVRRAVEQGTSLEEMLKNETVTGNEEGEPVEIRDTGESFSWLRTSTAPGTGLAGFNRPELSSLSAVEKAGHQFMQVVFDELDRGEVGVAPNADRSVFYVVYVKDRTPSSEGGMQALRDRFLRENFFGGGFMPTPYIHVVGGRQNEARARWVDGLLEKYDYTGIRVAADTGSR